MQPEISVIIPTFNRLPLLRKQIEALLAQQGAPAFEIIPVDDGSTDGTAGWLQEISEIDPRVRPVMQANSGPAAARNAGAAEAHGNILAFTDDDCIAALDWLARLYAAFIENPGICGIQGRTLSDRAAITPVTHQIHNENGHPAVPTCNAAYRTSLFRRAGGFDTAFPSAHNEDADLAWRIQAYGDIRFEQSVIVHHPPRPDRFSKLLKRMRLLESEFYLYRKVPDMYRRYRGRSPWTVIYGQVFFTHQLKNLKSRARFLNRPRLFFAGVALSLFWWIDLIRLFPRFLQAAQKTSK